MTLTRTRPNVSQRVIDFLAIDGGWLSAPALAADLGIREETVERALQRLRLAGAVASRRVELACIGCGPSPGRLEAYTEWRALVDWIDPE